MQGWQVDLSADRRVPTGHTQVVPESVNDFGQVMQSVAFDPLQVAQEASRASHREVSAFRKNLALQSQVRVVDSVALAQHDEHLLGLESVHVLQVVWQAEH